MGFLNTLKIRREITKLTLYSINLSGVFPIKKQTTGFVRYFCICFTIFEMLYLCVLSLVEAFTRNYDFIVYVSIIVTVISCLVCFCNQVAFTFYKQALGEIIRMIDIGFYTYSDEQVSKCNRIFSIFSRRINFLKNRFDETTFISLHKI